MTEHVNKTFAVVELDEPIKRGETEITRVTIRKPNSGALRGVRLQVLMEMDVNSMTEILPRITDPSLTKPEIGAMPPGDLLNMSIEVVNFLLPKSMQADYRND
ncbi:phage tail assembly protein [Morganella morganii]|uniref:Phage tail protein n=1 Tax=Morganella morganii TaxID=582 RepID=A0A0D8L4Q2_MORMO|nr:phage tail assembly protein [Morganella morganii]KJF76900.1 phage tail protein [Morganella morganii]MCU6212401.1 phage tail assembly protein [Morganella morganii]HAT1528277.1 phage tail assembly protein [Morganella morganii]HBH7053335.1 phage tail assembly protein [Morganella morganii]HDF2366317.1 phage tail assembly protein [Morganella morganii]